jgi:hypothetical protein
VTAFRNGVTNLGEPEHPSVCFANVVA